MTLTENCRETVSKTKNSVSNNFTFNTSIKPKLETFVLISFFMIQKGILQKLQPIRKRSFQIIGKFTDFPYKL